MVWAGLGWLGPAWAALDKPGLTWAGTGWHGLWAWAARANYLAADRPDLQYSAKEMCRFMQEPTELGVTALKRLTRYLVGKPRYINWFVWQPRQKAVRVKADANHGNCTATRKSTTSVLAKLGAHCLSAAVNNQAVVALSSGEAEL